MLKTFELPLYESREERFIYEAYILIYVKYMVQAMINIAERANRVLNIVKAQHGFKTKSEAIDLVVATYEKISLEPELRPEYKKKLDKIVKGKHLSRAAFKREVS